MKKILVFFAFLLSFCTAFSQSFPTDTLQKKGRPGNRINLIFVGEGFQSGQQTRFTTKATDAYKYILGTSPFSNDSNFYNVYAIKVVSTDSGISHPCIAADCPRSEGICTQPVSNKNTYFGCKYDYLGIHRFISPGDATKLNAVLSANLLWWGNATAKRNSIVIILINSFYPGGASEGTVAVSTIDSYGYETVVHELGHSLAGLGDEYGGNTCPGVESWNTALTNNLSIIRWKNWIGVTGVGAFQGAGYCNTGCYRPEVNCKMRALTIPFCHVCKERIVYAASYFVNLLDATTPSSNTINLTAGTSQAFTATGVLPVPNSLKYVWTLDNVVVSGATNYTVVNNSVASGAHTLKISLSDSTYVSRTLMPVYTRSWTVNTVISAITCNAPTTLVTDTNLNVNDYDLGWTAGSGDTAYHVLFKLSTNTNWTNYYPTTNSLALKGLTYGATYQFQVQGICTGRVLSPYSTISSFTVANAPICNSPVNVTSTTTDSSAVIKWSPVTGASSYRITTAFGDALIYSSTDTVLTISNLDDTTLYTVQLSTLCSNGLFSTPVNYSFLTKKSPTISGCQSPFIAIKTNSAASKKANFTVFLSGTGTNDKLYSVQWSYPGQNRWQNLANIIAPQNTRTYSLSSNKTYEIRIRVRCNAGNPPVGTDLPWQNLIIVTGTGSTYIVQ